jgi:DNA-binding MarR family transcriptional regulator
MSVSARTRIEAALRPLGVTFPQYACMHVLYEHPGLSGSEVARRSFVSRQMIHRELSELRALGWITQERSAEDRRADLLFLTDVGRAQLEAAFEPVLEAERGLLSAITPEERDTLTELLRRCDEDIRLADL